MVEFFHIDSEFKCTTKSHENYCTGSLVQFLWLNVLHVVNPYVIGQIKPSTRNIFII